MDAFITEFLDIGMLSYRRELEELSVTSEATLRYLRPREVHAMKIPDVFKRMLIDKILTLQTPESREKMKRKLSSPSDTIDRSVTVRPKLSVKKLEFSDKHMDAAHPGEFDVESETESAGDVRETESDTDRQNVGKPSLEVELARIVEEVDTVTLVMKQKQEELRLLRATPVEQLPLALPGVGILKTVCDNCHHKGHRSAGNKGNRDCPFAKCIGFHYCGLLTKHKEHRSEVAEVSVHTLMIHEVEPRLAYPDGGGEAGSFGLEVGTHVRQQIQVLESVFEQRSSNSSCLIRVWNSAKNC
jgi:hypothetical protein